MIAVVAGMVVLVLSWPHHCLRWQAPSVEIAAVGFVAVDGPAVVVVAAAGSTRVVDTALALEVFARNWDAVEAPFGKVVSRRSSGG